MNSDVTLGLAFLAGLISFISPCVLPLVPAYIGYMGGRMTRQISQSQPGETRRQTLGRRFHTLTHGLFFVLGFTLFFVLFGLLTTAAVSSLTSLGVTESEVREGIARTGGTAVIVFGLHVMGSLNRLFGWLLKQAAQLDRSPYGNVISAVLTLGLIVALYWLFVESWFLTLVVVLVSLQIFRDAFKADTPGEFWSRVILRVQTALYVDTRRQRQPQDQYGYLGSLLMGVVFSAGWTPCIGPIYGAVLTLASSGGSISEAGVLLTAYSLGLGIPFLLTALALDQAQGLFRRLQKNMRRIEVFSGVFLILIGVLVFSGQLQRLSSVGGTEGSLGGLSINLEDCAVGAVEGRVQWSRMPDCIQDGLKDDFYLTYAKSTPQVVAEIPTTSDALPLTEPTGLDIPSLGADETASPGLNVPELSAGPDGLSGPEAQAAPPQSPALTTDPAGVVEGLAVGQRAPDFATQTLDGQLVSLSDYRGRVVLLNFWATWCAPCRREMPDFQTLYDVYGADGFVVLAVNNQDGADEVAQFVEEVGISFPVLLDPSGTINEALYGSAIQGYPTSFLIDASGVIVERYPGLVSGSDLLLRLQDLLIN